MKKIILVLFVMTVVPGCHQDLPAQKKNRKAGSAVQPAVTIKPEAQKQVQTATVVPVIVDGEAQKIPAFENADDWIREDLWVETEFDSDGDGKRDRMHVDVTRPKQTDTEGIKLPVVYESSPYFAGTAGNNKEYFWNVRHELNTVPKPHIHPPQIKRRGERPVISNSQVKAWLPYGFAVVHSSAPGTGLSQGCPTIGTRIEALAPKAVIDWLNGRAKGYTTPDGNEEVKAYWATGKVGMIGTSYNGTIPFAAATTGVEGLEAIIPVAPNTSYYHYYRSNGLVRSPGGYLGEDADVLYDFIFSNPDNCNYCDSVVRDGEMAAGLDRVTGDYNEFWAKRDLMNYMKPYKAATLMAHAFNDWNVVPSHSYRFIEKLKEMGVPLQIYYHQGGHGGEPPFKMMNRWFTRYLFGIENGVENDPKAWIVREGAERLSPTAYTDYPHPDARPVTLYLTGGAPEAGGLVMTKQAKQEKETLVDNYSFTGSSLAQAEYSNHRLLYLTPVLTEPVHISGVVKVKIRAASSKPAVNLSVWMVALPWEDGRMTRMTESIITRGWADLQNHRSLTESEPLVPGKFYEMSFGLEPDDQIIPAGKQIGLMIFSSDKEFTLHPVPGTELTVDLDGTEVTIPVVGGIIK
ncbi:MAG TPA: Xaa-Pro dipeptidyl-peptidase [Bacteroidales bacterium]|jgi:X-Pro dipeptidyl-peptidase|nr:Xaa-Pro dipeptidyl-peptidase [Bacteroidales bacterium]MDI9532399.1 Xaa-Pro dipeptidyl-peptidase [Bacteroidota bacterium]OPZ57017.1 MAG: Xaa-Pro dipeptidyl-peptidase [Bacteroidetes bacterium ADurb.BinA012]MBP8708753.1 Xaa-Pro dipeptidyl-peptidase [Bacteroidales bacterium]HOT18082.1 Xaa-Pro dipeptidyl-peptidase [Bacteroidales bacterium]